MELLRQGAAASAARAFVEYDVGAKGHLRRAEFKAAHLDLFGTLPSRTELDQYLPKDNNRLELPHLTEIVAAKLARLDADEMVRRTFRAFDTCRKGFISYTDFNTAVREVAPHLREATIRLAFSSVDSSGRGRVSYQDFLDMLRAAAVNEGQRAHEAGLPPTPETMPPLRAAVAHFQAHLKAL